MYVLADEVGIASVIKGISGCMCWIMRLVLHQLSRDYSLVYLFADEVGIASLIKRLISGVYVG